MDRIGSAGNCCLSAIIERNDPKSRGRAPARVVPSLLGRNIEAEESKKDPKIFVRILCRCEQLLEMQAMRQLFDAGGEQYSDVYGSERKVRSPMRHENA